jgi:tetratricopeptide (TPR) repeat protein
MSQRTWRRQAAWAWIAGATLLAWFAVTVPVAAAGQVPDTLWDDPAFALYRQAVEALQRKDYEQASRLASQAIQHYPDHVLAHYLQGQAALATSKWEAAAAAFAKVVERYPASFAARRDLGTALEQLGKTDEATRAWEAALAQQPDAEDVRVRLAFLLFQVGHKDRAEPHLVRLVEQGSKVPEVWTALARLRYERDEFAPSEAAFRRAAELRDDGKTWFNLGVVRLRLDDRQGALAAFERAARHPETREQAETQIKALRASAPSEPSQKAKGRPPGPTGPDPAPQKRK